MRLTPFVRKWNPYRALLPLHPPGRVDARQNNEQQLLWRQLLQQQVHSAYTFLGVVGSTYHSESACTFLGVVRSTNHSESACTFLGVVGSTHHSESACTFLGVVGSTNHSECTHGFTHTSSPAASEQELQQLVEAVVKRYHLFFEICFISKSRASATGLQQRVWVVRWGG